MFKCKVCAAKDDLIAHLKSEVAYLRELAIPQNDPYSLPPFVLQQQAILDQNEEVAPHPVDKSETEEETF